MACAGQVCCPGVTSGAQTWLGRYVLAKAKCSREGGLGFQQRAQERPEVGGPTEHQVGGL